MPSYSFQSSEDLYQHQRRRLPAPAWQLLTTGALTATLTLYALSPTAATSSTDVTATNLHLSTSTATFPSARIALPTPPSTSAPQPLAPSTRRAAGAGTYAPAAGAAAGQGVARGTGRHQEGTPRFPSTATYNSATSVYWLLAIPAAVLGWVLMAPRRKEAQQPPLAMAAYTSLLGSGPQTSYTMRRTTALHASPNESAPDALVPKTTPLLQPKSPTGEFLQFIVKDQPMLFEESVNAQIELLCQEQKKDNLPAADPQDPSELVLYERINQQKIRTRKGAVEDLLYFSILHEFDKLGVPPLQPQQLQRMADFGAVNFEALTSGVHSQEALEVVRSHMRAVLGAMMEDPMGGMMSAVKISKFHAAQMYAASVLFGYFLRRADKRFALAKSVGMTPTVMTQQETITMLEELFNRADDEEPQEEAPVQRGRKMTLKDYIESFTPEMMNETARIVSQEAARVLQDYEGALFGDLAKLQQQFNDALNEGGPPMTPDELLQRMQAAVMEDKVDVLVMGFSDQRRIVLEAVAFGTFLRDAESHIDATSDVPLLTPYNFQGKPPPGILPPGADAGPGAL